MNLLADECIERTVVEYLRSQGFNIDYIAENLLGASDDVVLELAQSSNAILLTADKDFGEIVFRQRRASAGVILTRLHGLRTSTKAEIIADALREYSDEMDGKFVVISPTTVRISRPPKAKKD